jgi:hypothetical protein
MSNKRPDIRSDLVRRVDSAPIPTSPVSRSRRDEELGLSILELSLRLNHVTRVSERIGLDNVHHLQRNVSIDVDLARLTGRQRHAARADQRPEQADERRLWVPISRHDRRDLAPVTVLDSAGHVVPRLTSHVTANLTSVALVQLFRMLLDANPGSTDRHSELYRIRHDWHRARWLVEAAVRSLITEGPAAERAEMAASARSSRNDPDQEIRSQAGRALEKLFDAEADFLALLETAAAEHPMVVLLPDQRARFHLRFDAPALPDDNGPAPPIPTWRTIIGALSLRREFDFCYRTGIPRAVESYHLTVDVAPEVTVKSLLLSTTVDVAAATAVADDVTKVAKRLSDRGVRPDEVLTREVMRGVSARLFAITHRRQLDADRLPTTRGDATLPAPADWWARAALDENGRASLIGRDDKQLLTVADEIDRLQIGRDVAGDNGPRENTAHAYWHRPQADHSGTRSTDPLRVRAYVLLSDEPPSLAGSVTRMIALLLAMVFGLGSYLTGGFGWLIANPGQPVTVRAESAVVTILLLVPGLLLSRLSIPATRAALGNLRMLARLLAYAAVIATTVLGAAIAAVPDSDAVPTGFFQGTGLCLVLLIVYSGLSLFVQVGRRRPAAATPIAPAWLRAASSRRSGRVERTDASFTV